MLKNKHIMEERYIFKRRVLTEKNPFLVSTILTNTKLLVEYYSKEHYIILSDFHHNMFEGKLVKKNVCIKNEKI